MQSTTFRYENAAEMAKLFDLEASGYVYSRLQNPTCDAVAAKIAALRLENSFLSQNEIKEIAVAQKKNGYAQ